MAADQQHALLESWRTSAALSSGMLKKWSRTEVGPLGVSALNESNALLETLHIWRISEMLSLDAQRKCLGAEVDLL